MATTRRSAIPAPKAPPKAKKTATKVQKTATKEIARRQCKRTTDEVRAVQQEVARTTDPVKRKSLVQHLEYILDQAIRVCGAYSVATGGRSLPGNIYSTVKGFTPGASAIIQSTEVPHVPYPPSHIR